MSKVDIFELRLAHQDGTLAVLEVTGYINNEAGEAISQRARQLLSDGHRALLFDLQGTRIINSIGISLLLEVLEAVLAVEGTLAFCTLSASIAKTFQIMGLAQYSRIFPDRSSALAELSPKR
ncbi:MAG: STAS domain-containing protein [Acidobacteriota bacterium]